jgi:hypothetical protein
VTARRVTEKIEDVPLTITAISADTIQKVGAVDLRSPTVNRTSPYSWMAFTCRTTRRLASP